MVVLLKSEYLGVIFEDSCEILVIFGDKVGVILLVISFGLKRKTPFILPNKISPD